jgi:hypothetical protein
LNKRIFENINIDDLLDSRDSTDFYTKWMGKFDFINGYIELNGEINKIRELVFKKTYSISESSDLAAYICDDFELICKYIFANNDDIWIQGYKDYFQNKY